MSRRIRPVLATPLIEEVLHGAKCKAGVSVDRSSSDVLARRAIAWKRYRASLLKTDGDWHYKREGSAGGRRIAGGGLTLVTLSWRHATIHVQTYRWSIPVVPRAGRDSIARCPRPRSARNRSAYRTQSIDRFGRTHAQCCNAQRVSRVSCRCRAVEGGSIRETTEAGEAGN
jgi:hypothetical protein